MTVIQVTPAQFEAAVDWLMGTDCGEEDSIRMTTHAGGNLGVELLDRAGSPVADVAFDPKGNA